MSEPIADHVSDIGRWLAVQASESADEAPIFWAPHDFTADEWQQVRSIEQLAVLISTALRPDNGVCFASGAPHRAGRTANFIALLGRESMVWAVNLWGGGDDLVGDVRRRGYPYDNYDSFSALDSAQIAAAWIRYGLVADEFDVRERDT